MGLHTENRTSFLKSPSKLGEQLSAGATLPADWYTDPTIFELEKKAIFGHTWSYVGRMDQIPNPGDYFACKVGDVPIVVLKDEHAQLRAYVNVCKHRGAEIVLDGSKGNRKTLQCHYHAWTWGLDGKLKAAPRSEQEAGFDKMDFPLTPVRAETLGPFIFINPDFSAPSFEETVGELPEILRQNGTDLNQIRYKETRFYEMNCNWKVVVENYLECYHCPIAHKGFTSLIDLNEYEVRPYKFISVQRGPLKDSAKTATDTKHFETSEGSKEGIYNFVWPTFMVNTYPGLGNASTNIIIPLGANKTLAVYEFFLDERIPPDEAKKTIDFIDEVQREDIIICESVQRGLNSGFYGQGRLILSKENGIQHFQRLVYEALTRS